MMMMPMMLAQDQMYVPQNCEPSVRLASTPRASDSGECRGRTRRRIAGTSLKKFETLTSLIVDPQVTVTRTTLSRAGGETCKEELTVVADDVRAERHAQMPGQAGEEEEEEQQPFELSKRGTSA